MKEQKKTNEYVPNEVFRYQISLKYENWLDDVYVYTKPFPEPESFDYDEYNQQEELVKEKYFTKERILELKKELISRIQDDDNPFDIYCIDRDGNYKVTEDQLFKLD